MQRLRLSLAFSPFFLGACALAPDTLTSTSAALDDIGSTDALVHENVIGDVAMEGRGTPSAGLQRAADYVIDQAKRAGTKGAINNAYLQPFTVGGFGGAAMVAHEDPSLDAASFGNDLFEHGIYLSGQASHETQHEMGAKLCAALASSGQVCPPGVQNGTEDPRQHVEPASAQQANNVVALMPGNGPHAEEIVLLSAHLDHLGKTSSGIYPGADDNGSGSAVMIAVMNQLAIDNQTHPIDRTVAFLWTAGEEKGLLGSAYFVDNPPASVPLAKIKQVINMDMVGRFDDTRFSIGVDSQATSATTATLFDAANSEMARPFVRINRDIQQYNQRQDGYSFSRRQIPTIFVFEGLSNPNGGGDLMANYHRKEDTLENLMADNGGSKIRRIKEMLANTIEKTANQ